MGKRRLFAGLVSIGSLIGLVGLSSVPAVAAELPWDRLSGPTGVETSIAVANHAYSGDWPVVYVASNKNPVDALPAATIGDGPVVLTDGNTLNLGGKKPGKVVLLGGTGAVAQGIEGQAKALVGDGNVQRLAGADRNATAAAIAEQWVKVNGNPKVVYVTKNAGAGSPDAVVASVLRDGPILTFTSDASAAALKDVIAKLNPGQVIALGVTHITAIGGTGVLPDSNVKAAAGEAAG
ncbi:cell wall-binding repeat-containing protein [Mobiluncus sp.]|uniref:cell wall-binding repeat-containing protein n=1 Tax=Mobiluncus sp. TaxID=47293 RepID=UPI002A90A258|nr:cell wall-binding repeat-containing protein [Mobiluncus sp.]MDY6076972.1 cell wall-binding repeat-containing protein [Mobiluncus sp.]